LNALSEQQVLTLAEVAVGAFQDAMRASVKPDVPEVPFSGPQRASALGTR
jgi:hypothetical protein